MKLTEKNIKELGIGLEIEVPDEIQDRDGKWYEVIGWRLPKKDEEYFAKEDGSVLTACLAHENKKDTERPILREIPKPTQEWLDKNGYTASEKPIELKYNNVKVVQFYDNIKDDSFQEHSIDGFSHRDLIGKRRFILTKGEKVELPPKLPPTCFEKYWFGLNDLPLPKPEGKNINQIVNHHWSDGGTGITNFEADEWPVYLQAVKEYGDKDLILVSNPMPPMRNNGAGALHRMNRPFNSDLSAFWEIHRRIQKELSKPISEPEHRASNCVKLSDNGYVPLACIGRDCTTCPDWILKVTKCPTCGKEIK